jgi:hypothetical protein
MRNPLLLVIILFFSLNGYGQNTRLHYIKFIHVGEKLLPVHTLTVSFEDGDIPKDSVEVLLDTLSVNNVTTDEDAFYTLLHYVKSANFQLGKAAGILDFGTFKIIHDGTYFYLPGNSVTRYFKKMVLLLKRKKSDPRLIQAIIDNYPWIFNP